MSMLISRDFHVDDTISVRARRAPGLDFSITLAQHSTRSCFRYRR